MLNDLSLGYEVIGDMSGFMGTWEVTRYEPCQDKNSFKGIRFRLDPNGDVTWHVPEELKMIPLFNCTIYDTNMPLYSSCESSWVRFGEYEGQIIEFESDQRKPKETVILRAEGLYTLYCKRVPDEISEEKYQIPFSLLPALEEGFFSDVTLFSANKKEFHAHSLILNIIGNGIDWHSKNHPLNNLPEDVLGNILYYMYTECLPENLKEETVRKVLSTVEQHPFLNKLSVISRKYLRNESLRKQIVGLVNEIHNALDKLIEDIRPKHPSIVDYLIDNPDQLCLMIKNCIRDAGAGFIKLIELCDLYHRSKPELSKNEQHEIIQYGKSRFFILISQMIQFLQLWKGSYGSMNAYQKHILSNFLVPEVTGIFDLLIELLMHINESLERIITLLDVEELNKSRSCFGNSCSYFLYLKEVKFLRKFSETVSCTYEMLKQKRRSYMEISHVEKMRNISINIEELVDEMPLFFMVRLEELMDYKDKILAWRDFKFFFQTCTSKISNFIHLMATHRNEVQEVALRACELVQRDAFNQSMQNLGLLEQNVLPSNVEDLPKPGDNSNNQPKYSHKLNLVESLCVPLKADRSTLSKNLLELYRNETNTDMEFEIVNYSEAEGPDESNSVSFKKTCIIKAHRVVVASRCDWFRKALLSGMKEDIDKKIVIHETNPETFKIFLGYLYSGKLSPSETTHEQLVDLVVLSDRFEVDPLKQACEMALEATIDTDNAIYLLSLADSYNAKTLKVNCLDFIAKHQELTEMDVFYELHSELQAVIFDHIWTQPVTDPVRPRRHNRRSYNEATDIESHFSRMNVNHASDADAVLQDRNRLERCISEIRDVIGEEAPREQLIQVILAADYDLCRAINYYYAKNN
ncbi:uncharacterized protein LOC123313618 [Coccinella septempunctata]|uniref:uncharacterized protein LOC123313618 n=1 Tax=Coccinella septempunctata TaxID=41139 RepID=UPI001D094D68|nr:uncharacterized protein LOC123313618 [Coccinella septempunctata]